MILIITVSLFDRTVLLMEIMDIAWHCQDPRIQKAELVSKSSLAF